MRQIDRTSIPKPRSLRSTRSAEARDLISSHFSLSAPFRRTRRPELDRSIWSAPDVVEALNILQERKCAYCERSLSQHGSKNGIQHIRPLQNARHENGEVSIDHYSWLAYEWENLALVCAECNQIEGRNVYPIEAKRAEPMLSAALCDAAELPLLLNPFSDTPETHLGFKFDGTCMGKTKRGSTSIEHWNLNHSELVSTRAHYFRLLTEHLRIYASEGKILDRSRFFSLLRKLTNPAAAHCGSILTFLLQGIPSHRTADSGELFLSTRTASDLIKELSEASLADLKEYASHLTSSDRFKIFKNIPIPRIKRNWVDRSPLTKIEIKNFRSIHSLQLMFSGSGSTDSRAPVAALLGENSAGKSSILQALALALMPSAHIRKIPKDSLASMVMLDSPYANITVAQASGRQSALTIDSDGSFHQKKNSTPQILAYGATRLFSDEHAKIKIYPKWQKTSSLFKRNETIRHPASWLREVGNGNQKAFEAVARALREILPVDSDDQIIQIDGELLVQRGNESMSLSSMSDGYRSLFAMALDIMRNMLIDFDNLEEATGIVLIDEIEIHLHPRWKIRVVTALRRAMPRVQFIYSTHDPLCLRGLDNGEVHVLVRGMNNRVNTLRGLPDVRLLRAEQLLTSEFFGLSSTSDPETDLMLNYDHSDDSSNGESSPQLSDMPIGDSPVDQIINEALRRHVAQVVSQQTIDRSKVYEDGVQEVLKALRAHRRGE